MRVLHVPCYSTADPVSTLDANISKLDNYSSIGLIATVQHLNRLDDVKKVLESKGKKVKVGGQILGCRHDNAIKLKVDCYLYLGSGRFHPIGVALKTDKPVYMLNPISGVLDEIT
ncbi:MAG: diphthamide synthesis protein, partial [Candidatus Altiarchaeota archaeon]